ncbi:HEAT repeat domain-containing protein [Yinghuangia soli]|uniref:HEAT repeat domain-containing protein n=1 Tax=Yinghuangia soli TaxID=2908204 RepID=A0AA41Q2T1_9ACTN|nr:hypothetical protein [Yinghuangia soli]MCF2530485.1 hypothetical protein [Yinghuangia soli]
MTPGRDPADRSIDAAADAFAWTWDGVSAASTAELVAALERDPTASRLANQAAARLVRAREAAAADVALRALASPRPIWAHHAATLLSLLGDERAVPLLAAWLDEFSRTRPEWQLGSVVIALGRFRTPEAQTALIRAVQGWPAESRKAWWAGNESSLLAESLLRMGTPEVLSTVYELSRTMTDPWHSRTYHLLARCGDARFEGFFIEMLAGPDYWAGLVGLQRVATPRAVPALTRIVLESPDRKARYAATRALTRTGRSALAAHIERPGSAEAGVAQRAAAAWSLGAYPLDVPGIRSIRRFLGDADAGVRARAADAFGRAPSDALHLYPYSEFVDAHADLLRALDDPWHRVRARAATALGRIACAGHAWPEEAEALPDVSLHLGAVAATDPVACVRDAAAAAVRAIDRHQGR